MDCIQGIAQRFGVRATFESSKSTCPVKRRDAHSKFIEEFSTFGLPKVRQLLAPDADRSITMLSVPNHIVLKAPTHCGKFENRQSFLPKLFHYAFPFRLTEFQAQIKSKNSSAIRLAHLIHSMPKDLASVKVGTRAPSTLAPFCFA
jgi:hypothetical protein